MGSGLDLRGAAADTVPSRLRLGPLGLTGPPRATVRGVFFLPVWVPMCDTSFMLKRPRDPNQLAKMVARIATGEEEDSASAKQRSGTRLRGRLGGLKGGKARARKLTPEQRVETARIAAEARWKKGR